MQAHVCLNVRGYTIPACMSVITRHSIYYMYVQHMHNRLRDTTALLGICVCFYYFTALQKHMHMYTVSY